MKKINFYIFCIFLLEIKTENYKIDNIFKSFFKLKNLSKINEPRAILSLNYLTGSIILSGTLNCGASTLSSASIIENETVGGTLAVTGASTLSGNTSIGGTLDVTDATTLSCTLSAGASTLASVTITGNETVGGTLCVTGTTTLSSTLSAGTSTLASATITGNETVGGTLYVSGNTIIDGSLKLSNLTNVNDNEKNYKNLVIDNNGNVFISKSSKFKFIKNNLKINNLKIIFDTYIKKINNLKINYKKIIFKYFKEFKNIKNEISILKKNIEKIKNI